MIERILLAPIPLEDEQTGPLCELGHGFVVEKFASPRWLQQEKEESMFLSSLEVDELDKEQYWLKLPVRGKPAIGRAEQDAQVKMHIFLFVSTLITPCYGMFMPFLLVEEPSSVPEGLVRRVLGLHESHELRLPDMFQHNVLTASSLKRADNCLDRSLALHKSGELAFRVASTLWTLGFKQSAYELKLLLWVMGIETLLGTSDRRGFTERLKILINLDERLYEEGINNEFGVRRDSEYTFAHIIDYLYDARGQIAHGRPISKTFLRTIAKKLSSVAGPRGLHNKPIELPVVVADAACLVLRKLFIAAQEDIRYSFLLGDAVVRERKLEGLVRAKTHLW